MKYHSGNEIRKMWLDFFKNKEHHILEPVSLIPVDDSSLLWINSGVATLKPYFDGRKTPPSPRLTNSQKSIRTNDIENVGYTARHHTLFEMLGNFSIGDYFKKEAIEYAWEFLTDTNWIGFDKEKLYITVYNEDEEAYKIWHDVIGIPRERIIQGTRITNFWDIGSGPCGPNSEIFYDRGIKYDVENVGLKLLIDDIENDRYLEVWNIVFSQFNNNGDGTYSDLPRKNIDTGAGFERITSIIQETATNFETDLFMPIIKKVEELIGGKYHYDVNNFFNNDQEQKKINTALKIIADHIRAVVFTIADGVFPGNKDRGYIIRRLIRRASLYGKKLDLDKPFLFLLVDEVINVMGEYYQYLQDKKEIIQKTILDEEIKFLKTLEQGSKFFNELKDRYGKITKENAFQLFESYGFPIELIEEEAKSNNIEVDSKGFYELLEHAKEISRIRRKDTNAMNLQNSIFTNLKINSEFIGYEHETIDSTKIVFMFKENQVVEELTNCEGYLILDQTPFYAEKGGQVSDTGLIRQNLTIAQVLDVQQGPNKQNIHFVNVKGTLKLNDFVEAQIDSDKRFYTRKNHSGTHLIHSALREVLGRHVMQIGSYNDEERLRIDISHNFPITLAQIAEVQQSVNFAISQAIKCEVIYTDMQTATNFYHALAFFTDKYEKEVRVVKFGAYSCELCGGTHVNNSKDVEDFLITGVESKGAGTFRIYAITSNKTIAQYLIAQYQKEKNDGLILFDKYNQVKDLLRDQLLEDSWTKIINLTISKVNLKILKQELVLFKEVFKQWQKKYDNHISQEFVKKYHNFKVHEQNGLKFIVHQFTFQTNVHNLKILVDDYKQRYQDVIIIFVDSTNEISQTIVLGIANNLQDKYHAGNIIKEWNKLLDGNGGGQVGLGQSSFKNSAAVLNLLAKPWEYIK